ncbi:L-histidine N(alpha)-methyltransferase [Hymenobacter sp. BRD128]|uniref:L-histidine N(alpha)-methyltransferase n=1 Tax=Hymenobacter sp. BRD128 TaxID=2675878 RepID=UPI0015661660|nr:L-histidine N(alpha)-methyltransferase [Hymenobacter sp. BRD128]QKG55971.1 L-histidine N(alpha)-methyltransferase [Hymenobacter sp. BRD128]
MNHLAEHLAQGFSQTPKTLSSKYFYDATGSRLFQQIMGLPEYYPTRTELAIFQEQGAAIARALAAGAGASQPLAVVELGAGDGLKTKLLLRELLTQPVALTYVPVDISASAIEELAASLLAELPGLPTEPLAAEYSAALTTLATRPGAKAVLFLGSNIGNFTPDEQVVFLGELAQPLTPADRLLVGFDLRKDPRRIHAAYDDGQGITAEFNFNLLRRLNAEAGADFQLDAWQHFPDYDPSTGAMRSWLVSRRAQTVRVAALAGQAFDIAAWEAIHTESSYKFSLPQIAGLAAAAGLRVVEVFQDAAADFADVVLAVAG